MDTVDGNLDRESQNESNEPLMDRDDVSDETKLRGLIVQTVADLGQQHSFDDVAKVVQQRCVDSGLNYSPETTTELLRTVLKEAAVASDGNDS